MREGYLITFLVVITSLGHSQSIDSLAEKNLYSFSNDNKTFFPSELKDTFNEQTFESFNPDYYTRILRRLGEESLSDKYKGKEIIRFTIVGSLDKHSVIKITNDGRQKTLLYKETYRNVTTIGAKSGKMSYLTNEVEFDSISNKYKLVKYKNRLIVGSPVIKEKISEKVINPITKQKTKLLTSEEWTDLVITINRQSFYDMKTIGGLAIDGQQLILETHTKNGYYIVDRCDPEDNLKKIFDCIMRLTGEQIEY